MTDGPILRDARQAAFNLVDNDPNLENSDNDLVRAQFIKNYQDKLHETNIS